ncbi:MAG TPA: glycerol-3-phosphate dehydrogenase [Pyrinomonadaceae bacterium]|jgi:glycerol-3-phosphate dehydrogenase
MRRDILSKIEGEEFDAIIVGAGVNGAGIARDAALRGLRVLLLDKTDVAGGTSAWATRLIHGGLRYLEHGELGLVRESLRERERLLRLAPHLVKPLPLLIPLYSDAARAPRTVRAGLLAYDLLAFDRSTPAHRALAPAAALELAPALAAEHLRGAALYYDAQVEYAERLCVENALDAAAHGARVVTHARVTRVSAREGRVSGVEFADELAGGTRRARAPVVVNAAGPWVDEVAGLAGDTWPRMIGGTKGSHIVVAPFAAAPRVALYAEARADARPFFIIPWNDLYLIGTTDTRFSGALDHVTADAAELDYLLAETNRVLPAARLTRADVLYAYAGVRPLAYESAGAPAGITRRHFIRDHAPRLAGFASVVGGKLTTYRELAEQAVNFVYRKLGRRAPACATRRTPLPGAACADFRAFAARFAAESPLGEKVSARLLRVYGTRAAEVLRLAQGDAELAHVFSPDSGAIGAEVVHAFRSELAETLADCLLRRTMVGLNRALGLDAVERAAALAQAHLGWTDARAQDEVHAYRRYVARFRPPRAG